VTFAHVAGVPVEELVPAAGALVLARTWVWLRLRQAGSRMTTGSSRRLRS
jgi:hypothetical protein